MGFQDLFTKNGGFGRQNRGRRDAILTPNELVLTFRGCPYNPIKGAQQDAQLSQRDRVVRCVSFGQKWKTRIGRQYFTDFIGLPLTTVT